MRLILDWMGETARAERHPQLGVAVDRDDRLRLLAEAVEALAPRLDPREARVKAPLLLEQMRKTTANTALSRLAGALATLAPRLNPEEGSRYAGAAARLVLERMDERTSPERLGELAVALAGLAPGLDPAEASRQARTAVERLVVQMGQTDSESGGELARGVVALAPRLDPEEASRQTRSTVQWLFEGMGRTTEDDELRTRASTVAALASNLKAPDQIQRGKLLATAVGSGSNPATLFAGLAPLAGASRPIPGRFSDQQLVDWLKRPDCPRPARQVFVERLGQQCGQDFANMWEFVEWAQKHRPDLDLTSPPRP
jgi:hypothetical protein